MFLQACVILFTVGVSASVHAGIPHPPSRTSACRDTAPSRNQIHPPGRGTPPGTRYIPLGPGTSPREQVHPLGPGTPPGADPPGADPPGIEHAGRHGQRAGGMHPTGMQSCVNLILCRVTWRRNSIQYRCVIRVKPHAKRWWY